MDNKKFETKTSASYIKTSAIKSVKWTALGEIASRSIQPIVTLVLARLLTPSDFGLVGVAMIAISLAQILQDFGLGKTLIQRETEVEKSANIIFWTNITLAIFIYFTIFVNAPFISGFFHEPNVTSVLRVLCLQIVLISFISVHQALFQRKFQFKQIFFVRLFSAIVPGIISIPLALYGYGVWSLVFGTIAGAFTQVVLFWIISSWRPQLSYDFQLAKQLFGFSIWVTLEAFLGWIIACGDSIILGHFLGIKDLGVYRVGVTFITLIFATFFNPLVPVTYSAFSRLQANKEETRQTFLKITKLIASISLPIGIALAILSPSISSIIFGQRWERIEIVIATIGIMHGIAWLVGINPEVYRASGRPDINSKLHIIQLCWYIPVYIFSAPYGLLVFCIGRLGVAIISMFLHMHFSQKLLNIGWIQFLKNINPILISALVSVVSIFFIKRMYSFANPFWDLFINGTTFILIYLSMIYLKDREFIYNSFRLFRLSVGK